MVCGLRVIFVADKDSNFKFGMATFGMLDETFEFEAAILDI